MREATIEELRRAPRVRVCCRVDVRQPHGVWSAVTGDLSARGCRIVSSQLPRRGSLLPLRLSSDLFAEELFTIGEVIWVDGEQLGVLFLDEAKRNGAISAADWVRQLVELGTSQDQGALLDHLVPAVSSARRGGARAAPLQQRRRRSG
jgi:PilZ domain-containing protein